MNRTLRSLLLASAFVLSSACASTKTCEERAQEAYQMCLNPRQTQYRDEAVEPTQSDAAQSCQLSHQQAVGQCHGEQPAPVPNLTPDAG